MILSAVDKLGRLIDPYDSRFQGYSVEDLKHRLDKHRLVHGLYCSCCSEQTGFTDVNLVRFTVVDGKYGFEHINKPNCEASTPSKPVVKESPKPMTSTEYLTDLSGLAKGCYVRIHQQEHYLYLVESVDDERVTVLLSAHKYKDKSLDTDFSGWKSFNAVVQLKFPKTKIVQLLEEYLLLAA